MPHVPAARWVLLTPLLLLLLAACGGGGRASGPVSSILDGSAGTEEVDEDTRNDGMSGGELALATSMFDSVNASRRSVGVRALAFHEVAAWAAYWHSVDMQEFDFYSDINPQGQDPFDRVQAVGVTGLRGVDELIARVTPTTAINLIVFAYLTSPEHREKLLDPDWTHLAVGVHAAEDELVHYTLIFMAR